MNIPDDEWERIKAVLDAAEEVARQHRLSRHYRAAADCICNTCAAVRGRREAQR